MSDESAEPEPGADDWIRLHGEDTPVRRKKALSTTLVVVLLAAAVGGIVGLLSNRQVALIVAAIVAAPLLFVVAFGSRRMVWLHHRELVVRTFGTRRIDLTRVTRIDVVITEIRNTRTVSLMVRPERGGPVKVDVAQYASGSGRELDLLPLRKLADAVANNTEANGMVFAELLVAHLRSTAKGDPLEARPLYRMASAAPSGKLTQRYTMQAVSKFVASLD